MKKEYKKHLKGMWSILIKYSFLFLAVILLCNAFLLVILKPVQRSVTSVSGFNYNKVIVSNKMYEQYPLIWKADNLITFYNDLGKHTNINSYIDINNKLSKMLNINKLNAGEIAISSKVADELHLSIGDTIASDFNIYDGQKKYSVKYIIPYISDFYEIYDNLDFSVAIIGNDKNIIDSLAGKYIYLLNDKLFDDYKNNEFSYTNSFDVKNELEDIQSKLNLAYMIYSFVIILINVITIILFGDRVRKETKKYIYDSFGISFAKQIEKNDFAVFVLLPVIIELLFLFIGLRFMGAFCCVTLSMVLLLIQIIGLMSGGRRYAKCNQI